MAQNKLHESEIHCTSVDGKFDFKCLNCRKHWQLPTPKNKRRFRVKCKCSSIHVINLNRRRHNRTTVNNEKAYLKIEDKNVVPAKLINSSFGGYCIEVQPRISKKISVGDSVVLQYYLNRTKCTDDFLVRSVSTKHVGLQFADQQFLTPGQRMIIRQNRRL